MPLFSVLSLLAKKKNGLRYIFSVLASNENLIHAERRHGTGSEQRPSQWAFLWQWWAIEGWVSNRVLRYFQSKESLKLPTAQNHQTWASPVAVPASFMTLDMLSFVNLPYLTPWTHMDFLISTLLHQSDSDVR